MTMKTLSPAALKSLSDIQTVKSVSTLPEATFLYCLSCVIHHYTGLQLIFAFKANQSASLGGSDGVSGAVLF